VAGAEPLLTFARGRMYYQGSSWAMCVTPSSCMRCWPH